MPSTTAVLVFVSMFAAAPRGGIRAFHLDVETGALAPAAVTDGVPHPFFLAIHPDGRTLYSVRAETFGPPDDEEVVAWRITGSDGRLEELGRQSTRGTASCHLDVDPSGRALLVANYASGDVAALPILPDGRLGPATSVQRHAGAGADPRRQDRPHAHGILAVPTAAGGTLAYAADLGIDQVLSYALDPAAATLAPARPPSATTPPGAGPRHLAVHPGRRWLYVINELANSVTVFDRDPESGRLAAGPTVSTLPADFTGTSHCADVALTPDGRFLYGTNRGHDSIAVFRVGADGRLERVAIVPSGGQGPQNLALTPDGRFLLCANMPGGNVVVFRIDPVTGALAAVGDPVAIASPSCIRLLPPRE